jgi:hypothetical protein
MVKVRDMVVGKSYKVNGRTRELTTKTEQGAGGSGGQEPYYKLKFSDDETEYSKDWDEEYEEVQKGGKRKTRRRRTLRKSHRRKSYRRR